MTKIVMRACLMAAMLAILPASAKDKVPRTLTRAELPQGFAIGSGSPVLALQVEVADGKVASWAPAGEGGGNLRGTRSGDAAQTTLMVSSALPEAIKFDLYVSTDGERFEYASTCGVTPGVSSFEMWERPITQFAMGNPRVLPKGRMDCD
ncbi:MULTISPECIES: hypothetical protein [unclassified Pseudoxanthomonas]|uniref:hypothetical protein n=1 Tax=unclassified Pseudoxanthomonas TaxID=2645906 RepID=UPI0008E3D77C|nr:MULTISPECIES: hypothetical protein [unclassified Pseudoxanthomonas]PPJ41576.1 hypothetical protein C0063_17300 [Pseudoxanthomonas sp. KAs_5_3]SFV29832.1 hypothetical protein SAMN05428990_1435 [Pseudoxanthomonas sp. YR558]